MQTNLEEAKLVLFWTRLVTGSYLSPPPEITGYQFWLWCGKYIHFKTAFTLRHIITMLFFHFLIIFSSSNSSVFAIRTTAAAYYSSSIGKPSLNSLDKASNTMMDSSELRTQSRCPVGQGISEPASLLGGTWEPVWLNNKHKSIQILGWALTECW